MSISYSLPFDLPDSLLPPSEKDKGYQTTEHDWYKAYLRFYLNSYYNRMVGFTNPDNYLEQLPIVTRGQFLMRYLNGKQENIIFKHFTKDLNNNTLRYRWQAGKEMATAFNNHRSIYNTQLGNKKVSAISLSRDTVLRKTAYIEAGGIQGDKNVMSVIRAAPGIVYSPLGDDARVENPSQGKLMATKFFKDKLEEDAVKMAYDIQERNFTNEKYLQAFSSFYGVGYAGMYTYVEEGRVKQRPLMYDELFYEKRDQDPLNRRMSGAGFFEYMTPQEIMVKWNKTEQEIKDIISACGSPNDYAMRNWPNFSWYRSDARRNTVAVVTCFFIAPRNTGKEKIKEKKGDVNYVNAKKKSNAVVVNDIYYVILAGNEYVLECGLANNVVESRDNKADVELPISVIDCFNVGGDGVSMAGLLYQLQDSLDFYKYKMKQKMGRDHGMVYTINGDMINSMSDNPSKILNDFTSIGFHVVNSSSGEYGEPSNDGKKLVDAFDFRIDAVGLDAYAKAYIMDSNTMDRICNLSPVMTGQQNFYVSENVRKGTIDSGYLALSFMLNTLTAWEEKNLQYAVNLFKQLNGAEGSELELVIGKNGVERVKMLEDARFEDVLIFIRTNDTIGEEKQAELIKLLMAYQQNPTPESAQGMRIAIGMLKADTYTEAEVLLDEYLEKVIVEKEQQAAIAQKQFEMEQANAKEIVAEQSAVALKSNENNNETKLAAKGLELAAQENNMQGKEMPA
jgi:hypothetical protein